MTINPGPNDVTTLERANAWLQVTPGTNDDIVQRMITAFSTRIQRWIGYNLLQANYTRTFNGQGGNKLYLPDIPVTAVSSLTILGSPVPAGAITNNTQQSGYYFDKYSVYVTGFSFLKGFQNITISYTAGYTVIPDDIEQACLDWMKIAYFRFASGVGPDVTQIKAGDTSMSWGSASVAVTDPSKIPIPTGIYVLLSDYQRKAQISGF